MKPEHFIFVFGILSCFCVIYVKLDEMECPDWARPRCQYKCRCTGDNCTSDGRCEGNAKCDCRWMGPMCKYGCPSGWFGSRCNYKCRCRNQACNKTGQCLSNSTCQRGWFGPECQYADLAYKSADSPLVVDADDNTCLDGTTEQIIIKPKQPFTFTWLRIIVAKNVSVILGDLLLTFSLDTIPVSCPDLKRQFVDWTTLDMHCNLTLYINQVTLFGGPTGFLCSVYVSGGRNVALKEKAAQSTTFSILIGGADFKFTADKAVDGNNGNNLLGTLSCSQTKKVYGNNPPPTWTLTLSKPRFVSRYVIYNRGDLLQDQLREFKLESFNSLNETLFVYTDTHPKNKVIYTISNQTEYVSIVTVSTSSSEKLLCLCEVEVYGDSICDFDHYGRECELECSCPYAQPCFVSTGGCPGGCPAGFQGPGCVDECQRGAYGDSCNSECSHHCQQPENITESPCDSVTGDCNEGCKKGFTGAKCDTEESGSSFLTIPIIVGLCLGIPIPVCLCLCCCKKKKIPPKEEKKVAPVQLTVEFET